MQISDWLDKAAQELGSAGLDEWEAVVSRGHSLTVAVSRGEVDKFVTSRQRGLAVRVINGASIGFAYLMGGDAQDIAGVVDQAKAAAQAADPDSGFSLVRPQPQPPDEDAFDASLEEEPPEAKIERAQRMRRAALEADDRVVHVHPAQVSESSGEIGLINNHGVRLTRRGTVVSAHLVAMAGQDGQQEMGWEGDSRRFAADLDLDVLGRMAGLQAAGLLGGAPVPDGRYNLVLENQVAAEFLDLFASSLQGDNLVKGRTLLAGKEGGQVVNPLVTIIDDGLYPRGLGTAPFDGEGWPQSKKILVDKGVLTGFVFDQFWGSRAGRATTGNSVRPSMAAPPGVGFTNLYLQPGQQPPSELIAGLDKGLIINQVMGLHTADPISGEFSLGASGHLVENGQVVRAVKSIAVAGTVSDVFNHVVTVGNDLRFFGSTGSPSILVEGVSVSGP
jgi:PmbA protein